MKPSTTFRSPLRMPRRAAAPALAAALVIGAAACASPAADDSASTDTPTGTPAQAEHVTLATLDGEDVTVPADKPAVMFFFTVSCGTCAQGVQALGEAHAHASDDADFLAVDLDPNEPAEQITAFMDDVQAADVPTATDTDGALSSAYGVNALGTLLIVTPQGEVAYWEYDPPAADILTALEKADA